jgi:DNA-binding protein HU-beta
MQKNPRNARFCLCTTAASGLNAARSLTKQKLPMAKALSKSQIAATVAEKVGITKKQAVQSLEALVELAYKNAKNTFTIPGLGKLVLVNRKARMGRNPATGATIKIAAKRVVKFRVAKAAKDAILGTK